MTKAYQKILNAYRKKACKGKSRPLEDGEIHFGCANYTGPGTRIDKYPNYPPYNGTDGCSRIHDLEYEQASKEQDPKKRSEMIKEADHKVLRCYEDYKDEGIYYKMSKLGIQSKQHLEKLLPQYLKGFNKFLA